jgi:hypothetical protein
MNKENKKAKRVLVIGFVVTALAIVFVTLVFAAECTGQDCSIATSLIVGNFAPNITWVESISNVILTGMSTKTVYVLFNVTDSNGYNDLNDSTALCMGYKSGETNRTSSTCTGIYPSGNDLTYNCTVDFQYYDAAASNWAWNCSVSDNDGNSTSNDTVVFTVSSVSYVGMDLTSFNWSNVNAGQEDQEADGNISLSNGGNQNFTSASVTAHNATNGGNVIPAVNFSLDADTGQDTGQTYMADNSSVAITTWFILPRGENSTEELYAYIDMPSVPNGVYTSTENWLIDITA